MSKNIHWREVALTLLGLVPLIGLNLPRDGHLAPLALLFLLGGLVVGARCRWPLWSLWWLGGSLLTLVSAALFWLPGPSRPAMTVLIWPFLLISALLSLALAPWMRGDGFLVAFALLPWSLELFRFVLFDDFYGGPSPRAFLMHVVAILIYASVALSVARRSSRRARWRVLLVGTLIYAAAVVVASFPVWAGYFLFPSLLPALALLPFGPIVTGLALDGYRRRYRLSWPVRLGGLAIITLSVASLLLPWLTGVALPPPPSAPMAREMSGARQPLIIDTDLSFDDYVAILYLLQHPHVEVIGVTVVDGVAHVDAGLENARRLLAMAGQRDVPVAAGPLAPSNVTVAFPALWRTTLDLAFRPALPKPVAPPDPTGASALIRRLAAESPTPVRIVALGPMTNVARALRDDAALASRLDAVVSTGGALKIDPETLSRHESEMDWNVLVDPRAMELVLRSGASVVLVPGDVTSWLGSDPMLVSEDFLDRFARASEGREAWLMGRIMRGWLLANPGLEAVSVWDGVVAAVSVEPTICTDWRHLSLSVRLEPTEDAAGLVVNEGRRPNSRVCLAGDQTAFEAAYLRAASR